MKLRNKLVALMAASMVVTSVPVVTMADATTSISVYNYKIKDTTVGFKANNRTSDNGMEIKQVVTSGTEFNANSVPTFEIEPSSNYSLGGNRVAPAQSAYLSITKDSSFQEEALVYYIDALAGDDQTTDLKFVEGEAADANIREFNGLTMSEILDLFEVDGKTVFTFFYDAAGDQLAGKFVAGEFVAGKFEDGEFVVDDYAAGINVTVMDLTEQEINERKFKSSIQIDFFGKFNKGKSYNVPFLVKVGGDKEVLAHLDGTDSFLEREKTFALTGTLSDKKLTATADSETITADNIEEIGEIRLDENQIGALAGAENRWIKIKLASSTDLQFNLKKTQDKIKATGKRGFYGEETLEGGLRVEYGKTSRDSEFDEQVLLVELPEDWTGTAKGQVVLTGIYVEPQEKTAATGDVNVTISEDLTQGGEESIKATKLVDSTTVKVAEVADYGVTLKCEPVKVKAGRSGVINETSTTFTLKESVKDSLVATRKIEFKLENGYIFGAADVDTDEEADEATYTTKAYKELAKERFNQLVADETIKFEKDAADKDGKKGFELTDLEINAEGQVIGFTGYFHRLDEEKSNEIKITMPVAAPLQATGDIKLTASNLFTRTYEKDVECVVANIVAPITVEVEQAAIKVGLQDQTAGKVTIKETDKGMIERGWIFLAAEDLQDGITFDVAPTVTVVNANGSTLAIDNVQISKDKKVVAFEVEKTSKEASAIEISNIKFTADRTVPEANYDLHIWGDALTDENILDVVSSNKTLTSGSYRAQYTDMFVVEDFITMTTKNTQDISAEGLKAATAHFVIGENKFTVNGETVEMDSAAYIKDNYTMVPVKYVAKAFGVEGNALQYDQATSTATIIAGSKVISITAGKAAIVVNGTTVPMATKAEVVDGRMCVPMAYIASALNVEKSWDATTKTATFTNQAE